MLGNLLGSLLGSLRGKRYNTLKNIFLHQYRDAATRIMPAVFEKISYPGTELIRKADFLEETGNNRVLGKGLKIGGIDQTLPMGLVAVFSKQSMRFNNKL